MASISSLSQFPCRPIGGIRREALSTAKPSVIQAKSAGFHPKTTAAKSSPSTGFSCPKKKLLSRALGDDGLGEEKWENPGGVGVAEEDPATAETGALKKQLVDSFYGTNRGLAASSETRAEVVELITQLESRNPTPAPTEALALLNGKWVLAYTSFVGIFPLFSKGTLPLVTVEEISQTIDSDLFTVQNSVVFSGPLATTSISTSAKFEVRSPKRVQIKFEEGIIGTPQLTDSIVLPEEVEVLGKKIDLSPFKGLITSLQDTASSVAKSLSSQPPLKFSLASGYAESWLLTTYLDNDLRISRGDGGSVFVLVKDGSPLLQPSYY